MWKNSNFQTQHFILSDAHSAWEKYRILTGQLLDRETALKTVKATALRQKAKLAAVQEANTNVDRFNAQADLAELEAALDIVQRDIVFATQERDFIQGLIDSLKPELEKTRIECFDDNAMFQHVQAHEWIERIKDKIINEISCGGLNPETLRIAKSHPDFKTELLPYLKKIAEIARKEPDKLLEYK